jgi:hypothetical protein
MSATRVANFDIRPKGERRSTGGAGVRSLQHRRFIATLPSILSGRSPCDCCHVRAGYLQLGVRVTDDWCVPLTRDEHTGRNGEHDGHERKFWEDNGYPIEAIRLLGEDLFRVTGDRPSALRIIELHRNLARLRFRRTVPFPNSPSLR